MTEHPDPIRDPLYDRPPTSHERMTGLPWNASYDNGPPPWDIGRPQPAVELLAAEGGFSGAVLDAGCGTGENALYIAALGLAVLGVDVAETALESARAKAVLRGIDVEFVTADALRLGRLERAFDTVLDCGLFHTFNDVERSQYEESLASVTEPGGTLHVLCFSDTGQDLGPHPVSQGALRAVFDRGGRWRVDTIQPHRLQTRDHDLGAPAWLATIRRV